MTHVYIGGGVAFFCMFLSIQFAKAFLSENSRLFTAMALFACSWALVLFAYGMLLKEDQIKEFSKSSESLIADKNKISPEVANRVASLKESADKLKNETDDSRGVVVAISSFLFVFVGGLLMLEGRSVKAKNEQLDGLKRDISAQLDREFPVRTETGELLNWLLSRYKFLTSEIKHLKVDELQLGALYLLLLLVAPRAYVIPLLGDRIDDHQVGVLFDCAADIIGFACLGLGAWWLVPDEKQDAITSPSATENHHMRSSLVILTCVLIIYSISEIVYYSFIWFHKETPEWMFYIFAILKVLTTCLLGGMVSYYGMPRKIRTKGWRHWLKLVVTTP